MKDKTFLNYWNIIALPVASFVILQMASLMIYSSGTPFYVLLFTGSFVSSVYIGWSAVRDYDCNAEDSCIAGMLFGLSIGIIPALLILDVLTTRFGIYSRVHTTVLKVAPSLLVPSIEVLVGVVPAHSIATGVFSMLSGYVAEKTKKKEQLLGIEKIL